MAERERREREREREREGKRERERGRGGGGGEREREREREDNIRLAGFLAWRLGLAPSWMAGRMAVRMAGSVAGWPAGWLLAAYGVLIVFVAAMLPACLLAWVAGCLPACSPPYRRCPLACLLPNILPKASGKERVRLVREREEVDRKREDLPRWILGG
jgi:hypothetical protein